MTRRLKFNLIFLFLTLVLLVLNLIIFYQENKIEWFRLISNLLMIFVFALNSYNENKKQKLQ